MRRRQITKNAIFIVSLLGLTATLAFMTTAAISDQFPRRCDWNKNENEGSSIIISATEITLSRTKPLGPGNIASEKAYGRAATNFNYRFAVGSYQSQPYLIKTPTGTWFTYTFAEYSLATWPFPVIFALSPIARLIRHARGSLGIENGRCPFCNHDLQFQNDPCPKCGKNARFF